MTKCKKCDDNILQTMNDYYDVLLFILTGYTALILIMVFDYNTSKDVLW